ncbi:gluconate 2-dehydrogenase subunit 3 family protein [Lacimicrobium alkaliphilum]|uniref:Gluconate 2-dehydrogenase subunit 3 family protein n=1 Tax=Lacimicrobium alkaliphilum TaxID=1526571 RepID=A0ABQ1RTW7_9ALTE|nr:gluconate 2-dehydrogenase subunit 3 family protein [Lacimicrobium alkaliphilum]GGD78860.1 hypothetical protein GCM10011357_37300 [Lacimicrobium alkaliphilum]
MKNYKAASMDRRSLLKGLGLVLGAHAANTLVSGNGLSVAMAFQQTPEGNRQLQLLTASQLQTLAVIGDLSIPKTDTPGALATDCHWFVDNQLHHCFEPQEQETVVAILDKIQAASVARFGNGFSQTEPARQLSLLNALEQTQQEFSLTDTQAFKLVKSLLVFGYFTSEVGMTKVLAYDPVPGGFKGSVPYASVGKAYSGGFPF